jgi:hypothetical protein
LPCASTSEMCCSSSPQQGEYFRHVWNQRIIVFKK